MKLQWILIPVVAAALVAPACAQQSAAAADPAKAQAQMVWTALSPIVGPYTVDLSAAGVQEVIARTGKRARDIQVLTRWGPVYFPWPKGVTPVTFEIYVEAPRMFDVTAAGYTEATKALYVAAFEAVLPQAVRSANAARAQAQRPRAQ